MSSKSMRAYEFVRKPLQEIESILTSNPEILVDNDENTRSLLHWAAWAGHEQLCNYILQRHPEQINARDDMEATPLVVATRGGHLPTVMLLVRSGADINHRNSRGHSALLHACWYYKPGIVNYLLQMGANVNIQDRQGDTPLHRASFYGFMEIADALLTGGANPNIANRMGNTPLHLACQIDEQSCAILLLKCGADHTQLNAYEKNPLDLASPSLLAAISSEVGTRQAG